MRRVILLGLSCVACTRDNPAFDGRPLADGDTSEQGDGDGDGTGDGDGDGDDSGDGDGDGDGDGEPSTSDLPPEPPTCGFQPMDGLALRVGGPENFGGLCDITGVNASGRIVSAMGSELVIEVCSPGCQQCNDETLPISTYPMTLDGHLPVNPGECVVVEAHGALGEASGGCYFGGLTIYDPDPLVPYVIATTRSYEPTMTGTMMLAGSVPPPDKAGNCSCEDVGQGNDCCYMAQSPPEFWSYSFEGELVLPGGYAMLMNVPNELGLAHVFKLFQAQALRSCDNPDLQLSWAVVAAL